MRTTLVSAEHNFAILFYRLHIVHWVQLQPNSETKIQAHNKVCDEQNQEVEIMGAPNLGQGMKSRGSGLYLKFHRTFDFNKTNRYSHKIEGTVLMRYQGQKRNLKNASPRRRALLLFSFEPKKRRSFSSLLSFFQTAISFSFSFSFFRSLSLSLLIFSFVVSIATLPFISHYAVCCLLHWF